jgi:hypothetical protein
VRKPLAGAEAAGYAVYHAVVITWLLVAAFGVAKPVGRQRHRQRSTRLGPLGRASSIRSESAAPATTGREAAELACEGCEQWSHQPRAEAAQIGGLSLAVGRRAQGHEPAPTLRVPSAERPLR